MNEILLERVTEKESPPMAAKQYLSVNEAAERLGVSRDSVLRWVNAGHFPGARRKGLSERSHFVIPFADVEQVAAKLGLPPIEEWPLPQNKNPTLQSGVGVAG